MSARSDRYEPGYSRVGRDIDQSGIGENERGEYDRRGYQPAQFGRVKKDIAGQIENLFALAGAVPAHGDGYPGWKPNLKSPLLDVAVKAYEELYDVPPAVKAIHAGLECGLFLEKNPGLHMISFGPTLRGVHSPDEKMHIPAVEKFWNHLTLILKKLAGH